MARPWWGCTPWRCREEEGKSVRPPAMPEMGSWLQTPNGEKLLEPERLPGGSLPFPRACLQRAEASSWTLLLALLLPMDNAPLVGGLSPVTGPRPQPAPASCPSVQTHSLGSAGVTVPLSPGTSWKPQCSTALPSVPLSSLPPCQPRLLWASLSQPFLFLSLGPFCCVPSQNALPRP